MFERFILNKIRQKGRQTIEACKKCSKVSLKIQIQGHLYRRVPQQNTRCTMKHHIVPAGTQIFVMQQVG